MEASQGWLEDRIYGIRMWDGGRAEYRTSDINSRVCTGDIKTEGQNGTDTGTEEQEVKERERGERRRRGEGKDREGEER